MIVSAAVATVWTSPDSPRELDRPALENPVRIREWLGSISVEERLALSTNNLVQTQVLYGSRVLVEEEQGDWVKVIIPDQRCRKDERGYPGWIPRRQLMEAPEYERQLAASDQKAVVTSPLAWLYTSESAAEMEISYLTTLPVLAVRDAWTAVATPHGPRLLKSADVRVTDGSPQTGGNTGEKIVACAKQFLGLHYLWGGMSGFGYDCSGFAYSMHRAQGILIPRDASDQANEGKWVEKEDLQPGDLLFFAHDEGKGRIHHVGIYVGDNAMIHSPDSRNAIEIVSLAGYKLEREHVISRRYW
ncbi:C40 family peptidase [Brevibacillus sp. SYP-B805]|uniref:C40 family peptidase n=1 Tax=Brevibacillus sp. SYP-B805 TaxID=1578199 RepID=UPI0013EC1575|nr:NlpC/P60 family protein [Brevibacillus sp. SYP-B805]NGQ94390.1 C40 family peptidase [Brevibacillus sp. SYP-B805]